MPVSVEKRVAVTLCYLADERRMRKVANAFGLGKSTVLKFVRCVTMAISRLPGPQYIKQPQTIEKVQEMATHFQKQPVCEQLVSILGRFRSHYAEVFYMSTRKAVRYSIDKVEDKVEDRKV